MGMAGGPEWSGRQGVLHVAGRGVGSSAPDSHIPVVGIGVGMGGLRRRATASRWWQRPARCLIPRLAALFLPRCNLPCGAQVRCRLDIVNIILTTIHEPATKAAWKPSARLPKFKPRHGVLLQVARSQLQVIATGRDADANSCWCARDEHVGSGALGKHDTDIIKIGHVVAYRQLARLRIAKRTDGSRSLWRPDMLSRAKGDRNKTTTGCIESLLNQPFLCRGTYFRSADDHQYDYSYDDTGPEGSCVLIPVLRHCVPCMRTSN
eukprot:106178-Chlamydomonas_euryale.AAC.3